MNVLLIDNRDSFTFNLADAFRTAGATVNVVRNDIAAAAALERAIDHRAALLLSPGPGAPQDAGCCLDLIRLAKGLVPLVGICLGHQAIVAEAGGTVKRAAEPFHGKCSALDHQGSGPFEGLPNPLTIGRYHSLCTPVADLPPRLTVDAELEGMAMAIRDDDAGQLGLQFHPESILTPKGDRLVAAMLNWARERQTHFAAALAAA
ncbi:anthranilate synthase component II [Sphingomonas jaspsi]|uniref:anthranilate synthase component II n=1 Tax=Sphingomonas jaspsi TaxID=392409 RepID=UPI0004AC9F0D|nr:aminodeoxychorismate/anthranilate synthase component II [Sphingomonas jaspsi]